MPGEWRLLTGWGRVTSTAAEVVRPRSETGFEEILSGAGPRGILARGLGRSYGDAAQNAGGLVADMTGWTGIHAFDPVTGEVRVAAGTSLDGLMRRLIPEGWFVPVTPGTRFVTVGGAIASDIHGKNHHRDGSFCDHVVSLDLLTPDVGRVTVSPPEAPDVFWATAGGMGLTGIVLQATIKLMRIETSKVLVDIEQASDLDDLMARLEEGDARYRYSVAWIDSLARGRHLGRGVLTRGEHATLEDLPREERPAALAFKPRSLASVPPGLPSLVRREAIRAFNELWFRRAPRAARGRLQSIGSFFHPLDGVSGWNRLYGRTGFVQYQFVVPFGREDALRSAFERLARAGCPSFLSVLKRMGGQHGLLAFASPGWTLAMDIPASMPGLGPLLDGLDDLVAEAGGRVYLTKDSRLRPEMLEAMYPGIERWRTIRDRLDSHHLMRSDLDRRLDLSGTTAPALARDRRVG